MSARRARLGPMVLKRKLAAIGGRLFPGLHINWESQCVPGWVFFNTHALWGRAGELKFCPPVGAF